MSNWNKLDQTALLLSQISANTEGGGDANITAVTKVSDDSGSMFSGGQKVFLVGGIRNVGSTTFVANDGRYAPFAVDAACKLITNDTNLDASRVVVGGDNAPAINVNLRGIKFGAQNQDLQAGGGNKNTGTLTVTIADDDTPLGVIAAKLDVIASKLTDIDNILNDVYVFASHSLKTST